ncbi:dimethylmenaquinone methyltransferase [Rhizobium pusense]|uniref:RraA family protein n=1 Tax=Agrobacterium pusense TaxID=648995 RepID=UPI001FCE04E2|nr:dimethylmenaquinone methyltransferase [Agrobacterium pusense]MCJ2876636.1 dimethylmenaquinone methyltransferase [Agrobacterium pusense]
MTIFQSYSVDTLAQAGRLGTSTLFEASGIATSSVDPAIRTVWPGAVAAGPAFPLQCSPGDNLAIHIAMEKAPRGAVLVIDAQGFVAGYWGEVLTVAAEAAGIAGLVIDGGVRDIAALRERRFPVFARGISMRGTIKASAPSVGKPVSLAGTPVAPGDLVVADDDGVLVLPDYAVADTLTRSQSRFEKEAAMMEKLKDGQTTLDLLGLSKWRDG